MRKHPAPLAKEPPRQPRAIIHVKKSDHGTEIHSRAESRKGWRIRMRCYELWPKAWHALAIPFMHRGEEN